MSNKHEKTEYSTQNQSSTYQTGSTKPPKSYRGVILFLLGLVIFLGGLATALGFTNLQLFKALSSQQDPAPCAVGFADTHEQSAVDARKSTVLGFSGETVSDFWHTYHGLPRGFFIQSVEEGSEAALQGILPGDVLTQVNGVPISSFEELQTQLQNADDTVDVVIYRDEMEIHLQLPVPNT